MFQTYLWSKKLRFNPKAKFTLALWVVLQVIDGSVEARVLFIRYDKSIIRRAFS